MVRNSVKVFIARKLLKQKAAPTEVGSLLQKTGHSTSVLQCFCQAAPRVVRTIVGTIYKAGYSSVRTTTTSIHYVLYSIQGALIWPTYLEAGTVLPRTRATGEIS